MIHRNSIQHSCPFSTYSKTSHEQHFIVRCKKCCSREGVARQRFSTYGSFFEYLRCCIRFCAPAGVKNLTRPLLTGGPLMRGRKKPAPSDQGSKIIQGLPWPWDSKKISRPQGSKNFPATLPKSPSPEVNYGTSLNKTGLICRSPCSHMQYAVHICKEWWLNVLFVMSVV